jgi:hypothetical protein
VQSSTSNCRFGGTCCGWIGLRSVPMTCAEGKWSAKSLAHSDELRFVLSDRPRSAHIAHIPVPVPTSSTLCTDPCQHKALRYCFRRSYLWVVAYWSEEQSPVQSEGVYMMACERSARASTSVEGNRVHTRCLAGPMPVRHSGPCSSRSAPTGARRDSICTHQYAPCR